MHVRYAILGGGLAAAAAVEGIREHDREGSIVLFSRENHPPYQRPALTKDVWGESFDLDRLPVHPEGYYAEQGVELRLRREIVELDPESRRVWDERGESVEFEHALIATGCRPRRLDAIGAETASVRYFRDLEDYLDLEQRLPRVQHVTIVGGGFTALEMTAALRGRDKAVTFVFPDEYPLRRILTREVGLALVEYLHGLEVETVSNETLVRIEETGGFVHARTFNGNELDTQLVLVDVGAEPQVELAEAAGLDTDDGVVVDELGRASRPGIWAAGDVAEFPYLALGQLMRVEGSDHARQHGRAVGANMAGANRPYDHLPLKWFRVGERQFEGVGELDPLLQTETFWVEPGREGVVFYLSDEIVRGVLLCDVTERLEWARELVREARPRSAADRAALVPSR